MTEHHIPVMKEATAHYLITAPDGVYIDGTLGLAGHASFLLDRLDKKAIYIGIDRDGEALQSARGRLVKHKNVRYYQNNFSAMQEIARELKIDHVHGVLLDLGVSSYQIDNDRRGFSYLRDVPLDMRMGMIQQKTAADIINEESVDRLTEIFRNYGEERNAPTIARAIEKARYLEPITTTGVLTEVIGRVVPERFRIKSFARIFQALRIAVNDELEQLKEGLQAGFSLLCRGGRLVVLSYHSLEDRIVKQYFVKKAQGCTCPPELPVCVCSKTPELKILTKKIIRPSADEISDNPRARSARLRAGERL